MSGQLLKPWDTNGGSGNRGISELTHPRLPYCQWLRRTATKTTKTTGLPSRSELLLDEQARSLAELEEQTGKSIRLQTEALYLQDQFDVVLM